ncbi:MAG: CoA transferase [Chloroflexi bacterium]|nr:CoA transferase [Chloroflexota bacterium]
MTGLPLEGVRVADFTWVAMGPMTTRYLADFGARVLRIESETRPDTMRTSPPFRDKVPGPNRSGAFAYWNAGKESIALNLKSPEGRHLARRLVLEWADVVVENFTAGVMEGWDLGYEALAKEKPGLVMLSLSTFGRRNHLSSQPGYGPLLTPLVGVTHLTGWPDRAPVCPGPFGAYLDFVLPRMAAFAVLSALDHQARTGRGAYLDISQFEASLQMVAPPVMAMADDGVEANRAGYHDPDMVPHGVYPCRRERDAALGEEAWIAIAVENEVQWRALKDAMGNPLWAEDPRFETVSERTACEEELDQRLSKWTRRYTARRLMVRLQRAGIPCGVVHSNRSLFSDAQLKHRGHFPTVRGPEIGEHRVDVPESLLSLTPHRIQRSAPLLGEHTYEVCREILGLVDMEIAKLMEKGVLR